VSAETYQFDISVESVCVEEQSALGDDCYLFAYTIIVYLDAAAKIPAAVIFAA
jgi:uncharacterized protein affecting Mg2+/Co2+ transport